MIKHPTSRFERRQLRQLHERKATKTSSIRKQIREKIKTQEAEDAIEKAFGDDDL